MAGAWVLEPPALDITGGHGPERSGARIGPTRFGSREVRPVDVAATGHLPAPRCWDGVDGAKQAARRIGRQGQMGLRNECTQRVVLRAGCRHRHAAHDLVGHRPSEVDHEGHGHSTSRPSHIGERPERERPGQGERRGSSGYQQCAASEAAPKGPASSSTAAGTSLPIAARVATRLIAIDGNR